MNVSDLSRWRAVLAPLGAGIAIVFFFVWLFGAALHQPAPHDLPVGFVGPDALLNRVVAGTEASAPGAFSFSTYPSEDDARSAILDRTISGALVVDQAQPAQPKVLVASAGGMSASSAISAAFTALVAASGQPGVSAVVEDMRALTASDSRGLVPFFLVLGVSLSAFIFVVLLRPRLTDLSLPGKIGALALYAVVCGLVASLAVSIVLGFDAKYWSVAGVCALLALAVATGTAACLSLFGRAGIGVAGLVLILLGNASSGSVVGSAFLPQPFRWLSPVLPVGPALESVRSVLYFDGAGSGWWLWTLAIWAAVSLVIVACAHAWRVKQVAVRERLHA